MGRGIAYVVALGDFETVLHDISVEILNYAVSEIKQDLQKGIAMEKVTEDGAATALARIRTEVDFERAVNNADFIIETVPEDINLKIKMFSRLDKTCKPETIFASNTSSLSITEMAAVTDRPQKMIGMHFYHPVSNTKLVEIIRGLETSDEAVAITKEVAEKLRREIIGIKESPGLITSRLNALFGNEAFYMLQGGLASAEDIDKAVRLGLNHPMGPFEMVDLVGLDTRLNVLNYLHQTFGEKYRPCPLLIQYVKAGRLGKKVGRGVYEYN